MEIRCTYYGTREYGYTIYMYTVLQRHEFRRSGRLQLISILFDCELYNRAGDIYIYIYHIVHSLGCDLCCFWCRCHFDIFISLLVRFHARESQLRFLNTPNAQMLQVSPIIKWFHAEEVVIPLKSSCDRARKLGNIIHVSISRPSVQPLITSSSKWTLWEIRSFD